MSKHFKGIPIAKSAPPVSKKMSVVSDAKKKARALRKANPPVMKTGATSYRKYTKF